MQTNGVRPEQRLVQLIDCPVTVDSWDQFQRVLLLATNNDAFAGLALPIAWQDCYRLAEEMEGLPYTRSVVQALRTHYFRKQDVE